MTAEWDTGLIGLTDDQRVTEFEAFVHSQKPAEKPWTPTEAVPYDFESRKQIEGIHPQLIKDVFQPTRAVDAGCGLRAHLVRFLRDLGVEACGFDLSIEGSRHHGIPAHLCLADLAMPVGTFPVKAIGRGDLVICREVLEHLSLLHVRRAVANLCRLSTQYIYVTTRFAKNPPHFLSVDGSDDLDPTHITMLTKPFLRTLFILEGCKSRPDLEAEMDWQQKGRVLVFEVDA